MSDVITSPNMSLPVPIVGQDPGPDWANNYNACLSVIDGHNHTSGSGVQLTQDGINLVASPTTFDSLGFNTSNATDLRSVRFTPQASPLALATDIGCIYEAGVDLYYNDGAGNQVQITSGGMVNATSSGISGGTATAAFVANVLIVNQDTNTPGNIKCGSVFIGNNTAGSNFVEVSAPNALGSNYQLILPAIPGGAKFMTLDSSGNMGTASNISAAQIAAASITGSQIAAGTITGTQIAANAALSGNVSVSGTFAVTGAVTASSTITATGAIVTSGSMRIGSASSLFFGPTDPRPALTRFASNAISIVASGGSSSYPIVVNGGSSVGLLICKCTTLIGGNGTIYTSINNNFAVGVSCTSISGLTSTFTFTDSSGYASGADYTVIATQTNGSGAISLGVNAPGTRTNATFVVTASGTVAGVNVIELMVVGGRND